MKFLDDAAPYAHWLLRIALGSVFLYHGLSKFPNLQGLAGMMQMPVFMVGLLAVTETSAGVLVLLGGIGKDWMTRLGGLLIVPPMLGAIALVHWPQWSFVSSESHPMGGMEFQFTLLMIGLYFALTGNGHSPVRHIARPEARTALS